MPPEIDFYKEFPNARSRRVFCSYCKDVAILVDSCIVYNGRSYGPIWYCSRCHAWVGCHKTADKKGLSCKPLGTLANNATRIARRQAHNAIDVMWKSRNGPSRQLVYKMLAEYLGIPPAKCHIGNFQEPECKRVLQFAIHVRDTSGYWRQAIRAHEEEQEQDPYPIVEYPGDPWWDDH